MRVLTRGSRGKAPTDERTGSVEAPLPSGYSCHHEGQALADEAAVPGSSLPPARSYGGEQHQGRGQALSFGYFWEIWCESNTIFFGNIIILGNIVIRISGKFGAKVIQYSLVIS